MTSVAIQKHLVTEYLYRKAEVGLSVTMGSAKTEVETEHIEHQLVDTKTVMIIINGADDISKVVADILGRPWHLASTLEDAVDVGGVNVVGIQAHDIKRNELQGRRKSYLVINTHRVDSGLPVDPDMTERSDYEFLYQDSPFFRRDLTRFLSHVLGQTVFHEKLLNKARSCLISTTFPDVRTALPNLDILTVGADAVELRVDLLKDPNSDTSTNQIPSLKYVGEQVMMLRQRTELPLIYTTRCTRENGMFPMDKPEIFYEYLHRAIQWGVEYIDVELWLPEDIRMRLYQLKGHSKIMSAFHDFSGNWNWTADAAQACFTASARYSDIVKMIAMINSMAGNYDLEYFRSTIRSKYAHPPLCAVNMGQLGQLSRALNSIFSPITHPLLPKIAAPGQLSSAEINTALHVMGQLPSQDIYTIGTPVSTSQSVFFEKCFNELGLPHRSTFVNRAHKGWAEKFVAQPNFGGAYLNPPLGLASTQSYLTSLTDAAQHIGLIDTIVVGRDGDQRTLIGDNATWKGIRATLTRDFVPSAYSDRAALVLSNSEADAAPSIFALRSLQVGKIYTVGFKAHGPMAYGLEPFTSIQSVEKLEQPFIIISALPSEKSSLVQPLLRHYSTKTGKATPVSRGKVFLDLASGPRKGDPLMVAAMSGWTTYGITDVSGWSTVETLRLLVGQNVPFDFVRMASGRVLY
ncbi:hypothetical protein MMC19_005453 [Ptychographa xylographoides]|nr:hypothetical protein [Ptychographa xylographoides]